MKFRIPQSRTHFTTLFSVFKKASFILLLLLITSLSAFASHFRYGNVSWTNPGGNTVTFNIQQAWRADYFGSVPAIGSTVDVLFPFDFGDGNFEEIIVTVTSVNNAEDWFYGIATLTHTYASSGSYTAGFYSCCRISQLQNNHDGDFSVFTTVNVGKGASSPVSSVTPIIDLATNDASASFGIAATSPSGKPLTFSLADGNDAAYGSFYVQPPGLTVNASTGVVTFPTTSLAIGNLYTTQILISDGAAKIAVDFLIRISNNTGVAPTFHYTVTPADGAIINASPGQPLKFTVKAKDNDAGDNVTLTAAGVPVGASTAPVLPTSGNPVSTQFMWTPDVSDLGSYVVVFQATDNSGRSQTTSVIIDVSQSTCGGTFKSFIYAIPATPVPGQQFHTIYKGYGFQSVLLTAIPIGGSGIAYKFKWENGSMLPVRLVSPNKTTTYKVAITDKKGCISYSAITIYVVDVRCGANNNEVQLCYNGNTMCVDKMQVQGMLNNGATLGSCSTVTIANAKFASADSKAAISAIPQTSSLTAYPNPAASVIHFKWDVNAGGSTKINILDLQGRVLIEKDMTTTGQSINIGKLSNGVYMAQLIVNGKPMGMTRFTVSK